jgi:hypothetical protein
MLTISRAKAQKHELAAASNHSAAATNDSDADDAAALDMSVAATTRASAIPSRTGVEKLRVSRGIWASTLTEMAA